MDATQIKGGARRFPNPSEEGSTAGFTPTVAHLRHTNADGKLEVVAVLYDDGGFNHAIDTIWKNLPEKEEVRGGGNVDAAKLLPVDR
jgi:carbonic anhydrase